MSKSYLMSITIHLGLFVGALFVTAPLIEKKQPQIEIELVDSAFAQQEAAPANSAAAGTPAEAFEPSVKQNKLMSETEAGLQPVPAEEIAHQEIIQQASVTAEARLADEIVVPEPAKAKTAAPKQETAKAKTAAVKTQQPKAKIQIASRAPVPETLDDIEASDLNYEAVEVAAAGTFNENDLDQDFDQIDHKRTEEVMARKSELDSQLKNLQQDMDQELSQIENDQQEKARARAEALEATRTANAKKLAQIRAGEEAAAREAAAKAARAQAAQQRASELAAANAARAEAAAAARAERLNGNGSGRHSGLARAEQAGSKSDGSGNSPYASGNGTVRSIENLKQRPGNPKPSYSVDERFRREQGTVVYHAFVTSDGALKDFKLIQSTGHRNLDEKTLAALRKWKFYPGQQGWVEIPQTWNLTGEAEEMPATLRRSLSRN